MGQVYGLDLVEYYHQQEKGLARSPMKRVHQAKGAGTALTDDGELGKGVELQVWLQSTQAGRGHSGTICGLVESNLKGLQRMCPQ